MLGLYFGIIISYHLFLHTHLSSVLILTLNVCISESVISLVQLNYLCFSACTGARDYRKLH